MASSKGYILVEGHGEVLAAQNLITRLSQASGLFLPWKTPLRWPNLHQWEGLRRGGVRTGAEFTRGKPDAGSLLVLRDEDDGCPRSLAPEMAERLRGLNLPFPTAYVLLHPEYEVLFLPCLAAMSPIGFPKGLEWDGETWESRRGIKEWLTRQLPKGRSYKPTVSQLAMTRLLDLDALRRSELPCFGSLERALAFLASNQERSGVTYP